MLANLQKHMLPTALVDKVVNGTSISIFNFQTICICFLYYVLFCGFSD